MSIVKMTLAICAGLLAHPANADDTYLPPTAPLVDSQLRVGGTLVSGAPNSRPCTYHDRTHPNYEKVDGLTTVSLPDIAGECFDVSFLLPEGVEYVSHTARLGAAAACTPTDPIIGGTACVPRTSYEGGKVKWNPHTILAGKECSASYGNCGNINLLEVLHPLTSCSNIGERYRTVYAYFALPLGHQSLNYELLIGVKKCPGPVMEGN